MLTSNPTLLITIVVVAGSALAMILMMLFTRDFDVEERMDIVPKNPRTKSPSSQSHVASQKGLPKLGAVLMPEDASKVNRLKTKLTQAGLYRHHSSAVYLGVKMILMIVPMAVGIALSGVGMLTLLEGVLFGAAIGLVGNVAPGLWLNHLKKSRQKQVRRAMPDALDVIVICLEGGIEPARVTGKSLRRNEDSPSAAGRRTLYRSTRNSTGTFYRRRLAPVRQSLRRGRTAQPCFGRHSSRTVWSEHCQCLSRSCGLIAIAPLSTCRSRSSESAGEIDFSNRALHLSGSVHRIDGTRGGAIT